MPFSNITGTEGCRCEQFPANWLQSGLGPGDNHSVSHSAHTDGMTAANPFQAGAMVVVTLGNPRDKFWGSILSLTPEGLSLCGMELASFDDVIAVLKEGGPLSPGVVFFPMHRVERIELDLPDGDVPSLSQRFSDRTGLDAAAELGKFHASQQVGDRGGR